MVRRIVLALALIALAPAPAICQPGGLLDDRWRSASPGAGGMANGAASVGAQARPSGEVPPIEPLRAIESAPRRPLARVTQGIDTLPNQQGQVWRDYDVSPYTLRVPSTNRPEQAIVDWILRQTGYEAWHGDVVSVLSAGPRTLRVYHTPEMHAVVADVVDRFVNSQAESQAFGVRVVSVGSPNWRAKALSILRPVRVQTQGIQAWLLEREDAALLVAELRRRSDFREHGSPHLLVVNGQSATVNATRMRSYVRDAVPRANAWPAFQQENGQFEEGFSLELSPLLSVDGRLIDAVIKCNVDQVERMVPVVLEVPAPAAPRQRTQIEVPQVSQFRLHERFRWPIDQVLVVGMGVTPSPAPEAPNPLTAALTLGGAAPRADVLVFIESRGRTPASAGPAAGSGDIFGRRD